MKHNHKSNNDCIHFSSTISKVFSHWTTGGRKGRMYSGGQTLDPAITQSVLMNTYTAANHDMQHSIAARNGKYYNEQHKKMKKNKLQYRFSCASKESNFKVNK